MALILLDSSVIFDHLNGRFGRAQFLERLIDQGHILACCPVNFTEVYAGLRPGQEEKTAAFMDSILGHLASMLLKADLLAADIKAGCGKCGACSALSTYERSLTA